LLPKKLEHYADNLSVSIISLAMLPRAKFIQGLILNMFAVAFAAAFGMLVVYSAIKARIHTTPARKPAPTTGNLNPAVTASLSSVPYNSSASAVAAVWLFFLVSISSLA
jgi:hypothetical protein